MDSRDIQGDLRCLSDGPRSDVHMSKTLGMPCSLASELLTSYADVLRVGKLLINGEVVEWNANGSTRQQFESFSCTIFSKMRCLSEVVEMTDQELWRIIFLYCKAVSLNFAMMEVLLYLNQTFGEFCTISSRKQDSHQMMVHYGFDIRKDRMGLRFCPHILLSAKGNLVSIPVEGDPCTLGTLSAVETEFGMTQVSNSTLQYRIKFRSDSSCVARMRWRKAMIMMPQPLLACS